MEKIAFRRRIEVRGSPEHQKQQTEENRARHGRATGVHGQNLDGRPEI